MWPNFDISHFLCLPWTGCPRLELLHHIGGQQVGRVGGTIPARRLAARWVVGGGAWARLGVDRGRPSPALATVPRGRAAHGVGQKKVGFAGYEAGISALSILAQYELTRHGHQRLAWLGQGIDVGFVGSTVVNNYRLDTAPLVTPARSRAQHGEEYSQVTTAARCAGAGDRFSLTSMNVLPRPCCFMSRSISSISTGVAPLALSSRRSVSSVRTVTHRETRVWQSVDAAAVTVHEVHEDPHMAAV
jgi:hypothetical protein